MNGKRLAAVMALTLGISAGGIQVFGEETANDAEASMENAVDDTAEGYTEEGDGYYSIVTWCQNEEKNIYGEFYYPEDFDESQTYPVIIMSHGLNVTHEIYEKGEWVYLAAEQGYVCYVFDFCGGSTSSLSDMDFTEMSVMTEVSDLKAVMDFVEGQSFCNPDQLYLMGQSQGGLATALTAAERGEEVAGMILLYPGFLIPDNIRTQFASKDEIPEGTFEMNNTEFGSQYALDVYDLDVYETIAAYDGDVLIIHGLNDASTLYTDSLKAITEAYSENASELVLITGDQSVHAFDVFYEEGQAYAHDAAIGFLSEHVNEE